MFSLKKSLFRKKGQATIEYILLLVVGVAISLGLMNQFSKPFRDYARGFFDGDGYYTCLMEYGVLPGMPIPNGGCQRPEIGEGDTSWADSSYNPNPGGGGGSGSGGGFNGNDDGDGGGGSDPYGGGNDPGLSPYNPNPYNNPSSSGIGGHGQSFDSFQAGGNDDLALGAGGGGFSNRFQTNLSKNKSSNLNNPLDNSANLKSSRRSRFQVLKNKKSLRKSSNLTSGDGSYDDEDSSSKKGGIFSTATLEGGKKEKEPLREAVISVSTKNTKKNEDTKKKKFFVEKKKVKKAQEIKDDPITFSKIFKYLLIFIAIAGLLYFVFNQFMQIRKNMEAA